MSDTENPVVFSYDPQDIQPVDMSTVTTKNIVPVDPQVASDRADKYAQVLQIPDAKNVLMSAITSNDLGRYQTQAVVSEYEREINLRRDALRNYIANRKGDVTQQELDIVRNMPIAKLKDSNLVLEEMYARNHIDKSTQELFQNAAFGEYLQQNNKEALDQINQAQTILTTKEYLQKKLEDVEARIKQQTYVQTGADYAASLVPFLSTYRFTNLLKGVGTPYIPGTNREDQYTQLYLNSPADAAKMIDQATEYLASKNLHQAREFLQGAMQFSSSDKVMANVTLGADIATLPVARAMKNVLSFASARSVTQGNLLNSVGQTTQAALADVIQQLDTKAANAVQGTQGWNQIKAWTSPIFDINALRTNASGNLSHNQALRLKESLEFNAQSILKGVFNDTNFVDRSIARPEVLNAALDEELRMFNVRYPNMNNAVLNVYPSTPVNRLANVEQVTFEVGDRTGALFDFSTQADLAAKDIYKFKDYKVVEADGGKWKIQVNKNIDEANASVFNQIMVETNHQTPGGLINTYAGALRSFEDTVAQDTIRQHKVAQYGSSAMTALIKSRAEDIGALPRASKNDLVSFLRNQQVTLNPTSNVPGVSSRTLPEFERDWFQYHNRVPTEQETRAYFTYLQLHSADLMSRNLAVYTSKARIGLENFSLKLDNVIENGQAIKVNMKDVIEGKVVPTIHFDNRGREVGHVLIWDRDPNLVRRTNTVTPGFGDQTIQSMINEGYKIIQLSHNGSNALREMPLGDIVNRIVRDGPHIDYVMTKEFGNSPIPLTQVPYRDGFHIQYPDRGYFVRQPNLASYGGNRPQTYYYGDNNVLHFDTRQQAEAYTTHLNRARELLAAGDDVGLRAYLAQHLPYTYNDFTRQFSQRGGPLNHNTPFYVTEMNQTVQEAHKIGDAFPGFVDAKNSVYNLYNGEVNLKFAQERGELLNTIERTGTVNNPVLQLRPARIMDPVEVMNRITSDFARGRYIGDLKARAVTEFMAEFHTAYKQPFDVLMQNPIQHIINGNFDKSAPKELLAEARNSRRAIINMLRLQDDFNKTVNHVLESVAGTIGDNATNRIVNAANYVDPLLLGAVKTPMQFFKNVAFTANMSMFNPIQFFKQLNTYVSMAGIAGPVNTAQAMFGATTMRALEATSETRIIRDAMSRAVEWGWDRNHFLEAYEGGKKIGFFNVGKEHAYLADYLQPKVVTSDTQKFLDHSAIFFNEGEKLTRYGAWNAAYLEWRRANPTRAFTDSVAKNEVLPRADLLNNNMSQASLAPWQTGSLSGTAQFFGYATRMTEQLLGSRLTASEKLRMVTAMSLAYGIPVGTVGATLGGFGPIHQLYYDALRARGIATDENKVMQVVNEGIPSAVLEWATGTKFNVKDSYGPSGNPFIKDFLTDDKGFWGKVDLLGGAGVKTTRQALGTVGTLLGVSGEKLVSLATGKDPNRVLEPQDFVDVLENFGTFNQARKLYYGLNYMEYHTKNEQVLMKNVTAAQAVINSVFGLEPQAIADYHNTIRNLKNEADAKKDVLKQAEQYFNLWTQSNDLATRERNENRMRALFVLGGIQPDEASRWMYQMTKRNMTTVSDRLQYDYALKDPVRFNKLAEKQREIAKGNTQ